MNNLVSSVAEQGCEEKSCKRPNSTFVSQMCFSILIFHPCLAAHLSPVTRVHLKLTYQSSIVEGEAEAYHLYGEVGVEHVEAGVDQEVVEAYWHQPGVELELHLR